MILGVQYYRAPFPNQKYWEDDFRKIKDSGLNAVQLWLLWGWIEAKPGRFDFSDYDRLFDFAAKYDLKVVASTIAEIQPLWIFREEPGCEMIDCNGNRVISSLRLECNFGLTPGGCTDHPGVRDRMMHFIQTVGEHFKNHPALHGWDIWNELRWCVQSEALVCWCPHTLAAWKRWLQCKYETLEKLNETWQRRYICWEDVQACIRKPDRTYTEYMAWQHFITDRSNAHCEDRYRAMRAIDTVHPITAHGDSPSPLYGDNSLVTALHRGNDWEMASALDGIGCSSFPLWQGIDDATFGTRIEMVASAANGKQIWLSELQGGRASTGFKLFQPVPGVKQQHWVWTGFGCGADVVLFWCWRDEVFGRESAGFGLNGRDGMAEERLAAMKASGKVLMDNEDLFANYRPEKADAAIFFNPQDYYIAWAQEHSSEIIKKGMRGYARAFVRNALGYRFVEASHLDALAGLKLLILPHSIVLDDTQGEIILEFVKAGGTLVCESECGAFSPAGFYRYPEERFLAKADIVELGRRACLEERLDISFESTTFRLQESQWATVLPENIPGMEIMARQAEGVLAARISYGKGQIIYLGSYFGYMGNEDDSEWERFIARIADCAGCSRKISVLSPVPDKSGFLYFRSGYSGNQRLLFLFFPENCQHAELDITNIPETRFKDLYTGQCFVSVSKGRRKILQVKPTRFGLALLVSEEASL
ncbi:MAG: beta-galactosidase [Victivallales bacterium]|nr:beta-galactosidase [Victivallales bacterium]